MKWVLILHVLCGQWVGLNLRECWYTFPTLYDTQADCENGEHPAAGEYRCIPYGTKVE